MPAEQNEIDALKNLRNLTLSEEQQQSLNALLASEKRLNQGIGYDRGRQESADQIAMAKESERLREEAQTALAKATEEKSSMQKMFDELNIKHVETASELERTKADAKKKQTALQEWIDKSRISNAIAATDPANGPASEWLASKCTIDADGKVSIDTGDGAKSLDEAAPSLKKSFPNLFRANVAGGVGSSNSYDRNANGSMIRGGRIDVAALAKTKEGTAEYMRLRTAARNGDASAKAALYG